MRRSRIIPLLSALVLCVGLSAIAQEFPVAQDVTIYRDEYGVPHIYGRTLPAVAYGFGYAQAEDHLAPMLRLIFEGNGESARLFGSGAVEKDMTARLFRFREIGSDAYRRMHAWERAYAGAFAAGINRYIRDHPAQTPAWARPVTGEMIVIYERSVMINYPLQQALSELRGVDGDAGGSNALAMNGAKSATGRPMLLIDPHLPWKGPMQWYEAHLAGPGLNVAGVSFFGCTTIALGHNEEYAWTNTNNAVDIADVYRERIHPREGNRYRDGDDWLEMHQVEAKIDVRLEDGEMATATRNLRYTKRGPVIEQGGEIYSIALGLWDHVIDQSSRFKLMQGRLLPDFIECLKPLAAPKFNFVYADRSGNIYYAYTGRIPRRNQDYDWSRPVPGWDPKTAWQGFHAFEELPQITNPIGNTLVQCNNNPFTVTPDSVLNADAYPAYMTDKRRPLSPATRAGRMAYLLEQSPTLTFQQFQDLSLDVYAIDAVKPRQLLLNAWKRLGGDFPDPDNRLAEAIRILDSWDLLATLDCTAIPLLGHWYAELRKMNPALRPAMVQPDDPVQQQAALFALRAAVDAMMRQYGIIEVPKRRVHGIQRGDRFYPVAGAGNAMSLLPFTSLFMAGCREYRDGIWYANEGSSFTMCISLEDRIEAVSMLPLSASENPESPHFADGTRRFSERQYKPAWFYREDVLAHAKSQTVLSMEE